MPMRSMTRTRRCGPCSRGAQERSRTCDFHGEPQARRAGASPAAASDAGRSARFIAGAIDDTHTALLPVAQELEWAQLHLRFPGEPQARRADASPAAASDAGHDLLELLPVRTMTRTRRCGPLLKIEHKGAAAFAIPEGSRESQAQDADQGLLNLLPAR